MEYKNVDENIHICYVCYDELVEQPWARLYPCGHGHHSACAAKWFSLRPEERTCPYCRTLWEPEGAPVAVAVSAATMEVTNHAVFVAYAALLQEAAAVLGPSLGAQMPADHPPPSRRPASELQDQCVVCRNMLDGKNWMETACCGCWVHVECAVDKAVSDSRTVQHAVDLRFVRCPGCNIHFPPPDLRGRYILQYIVRPVLPDTDTRIGDGFQVDVESFWVVFMKVMIDERDLELEVIRHTDSLSRDEARRMYKADRDLDILELQQICYLCRLPLACNYWVDVGPCQHCFHVRCLGDQVTAEWDDAVGPVVVCAVCNYTIVFRGNLDNFLWKPIDAAEGGSKFWLNEMAFWWEVDAQTKAKEDAMILGP